MSMGDTCEGCGCTNDRACQPDGCYWVRQGWCSACHVKSIKPVADLAVRWMRKVSRHAPQQNHEGLIANRACKIALNLEGPHLEVRDHIGAVVFTLEPGRAFLAPQYKAAELATLFEGLFSKAA